MGSPGRRGWIRGGNEDDIVSVSLSLIARKSPVYRVAKQDSLDIASILSRLYRTQGP
jgi:hypothetical protein